MTEDLTLVIYPFLIVSRQYNLYRQIYYTHIVHDFLSLY